MLTILSFRALHITRALSCEAWSDRPRPAQHLLISIKLPLLVIQATFIDIHKKEHINVTTLHCLAISLDYRKFEIGFASQGSFRWTSFEHYPRWFCKIRHTLEKIVHKLYFLITSTFITKVLSNLQADGHDLVIAAFVRVPESTQTDSQAELRISLTTENSVLQ